MTVRCRTDRKGRHYTGKPQAIVARNLVVLPHGGNVEFVCRYGCRSGRAERPCTGKQMRMPPPLPIPPYKPAWKYLAISSLTEPNRTNSCRKNGRESLHGGSQNGGLRPLSAIRTQSSTIVHFYGPFRPLSPFGPLSKRNFRRKMTTIVGNRVQLWTSTLSPHLLSPHLDFPKTGFGFGNRSLKSQIAGDFPSHPEAGWSPVYKPLDISMIAFKTRGLDRAE